jgi:SAM-dependent methyltransferase
MRPQPDDETLARAYPDSYQPHGGREGLLYRLFDPLLQSEADRLACTADTNSPVLDIGCGGGDYLGRLRRAGWRGALRGVEPGSAGAEHARRTLGVEVIESTLEHAPLPERSESTIVLRHVIEHVRDPDVAVGRLAAALRPGGHLYLATPNVRALGATVFRRFWCGYDPPRHLVCFTDRALLALLRRHGLEPVRSYHDFSPHLWLLSTQLALAGKSRRRWAALAGAPYSPPAAGLAVVGGLLEVALRRASQFGVIARKPLTA